jgi:hypothetical protein
MIKDVTSSKQSSQKNLQSSQTLDTQEKNLKRSADFIEKEKTLKNLLKKKKLEGSTDTHSITSGNEDEIEVPTDDELNAEVEEGIELYLKEGCKISTFLKVYRRHRSTCKECSQGTRCDKFTISLPIPTFYY